MNQSQSPTSPDSAPSLSKRRGKGNHRFPNARDKSRACRAHAADAVPYQSPAPPDFDTTACAVPQGTFSCPTGNSPCGGAASFAVRTRGGYPNKFPWELVRYIGGTASPLYERQRFSCRSGSARCGRSRHPRAATDAPRRRCGSCPTGRPADDGCPKRSSRSSPERLPESASCR